jgi:preprotein translocase subunit SecF
MTTTEDRPIPTPAPRRAGSRWHRLYHGETTYDFVGRRRIGFIISGVVILLSVLSLFTRGLNLGIDFEGGVAWELPASNGMTVSEAKSILQADGINVSDAKVQSLSGAGGNRIRIQVGAQTNDVQTKIRNDLAAKAGINQQDVSVNSVSPSWGTEITKKAVRALIAFFIAIALYISIRFEWRMAIGALVAVLHDVLISVGIYSIFGFQVTPETVVAFLTILGFSLYDTIVVFDKVHENTKRFAGGRTTYREIVNLSMNQTLMRSLNTSLAAVLPVLSLLVVGSWIMGAVALEDFAVALLVGLITGSYSSIFIATPILASLKSREPKWKAVADRAARSADAGMRNAVGAPVMATVAADGAETATTAAASPSTPSPSPSPSNGSRPSTSTAGFSHPPRPRKKKRR